MIKKLLNSLRLYKYVISIIFHIICIQRSLNFLFILKKFNAYYIKIHCSKYDLIDNFGRLPPFNSANEHLVDVSFLFLK